MSENEKLNTGYTEVPNDASAAAENEEKVEVVEAEIVEVPGQSAGSGFGGNTQNNQGGQNAQYTQNANGDPSFREKAAHAASEASRVVAGASEATICLVLGILSILCWFFRSFSPLAIVFGIIGLVFASKSKKCGFNGGIRTAGFVCSLIGLIGGVFGLVACLACTGTFAVLSMLS